MAESIHRRVWQALLAKLVAAQASGQPLDAVSENSLYQGARDTIPSGSFPAIVADLLSVTEERHTAPGRILATYRFTLHCMVENIKMENQVAGTDPDTALGIIDLVEKVKNVVTADQKLGLTAYGVLRVNVPEVTYFVDNYPVREASVTVEVQAVYQDAAR